MIQVAQSPSERTLLVNLVDIITDSTIRIFQAGNDHEFACRKYNFVHNRSPIGLDLSWGLSPVHCGFCRGHNICLSGVRLAVLS